jgi:hypothetical protein
MKESIKESEVSTYTIGQHFDTLRQHSFQADGGNPLGTGRPQTPDRSKDASLKPTLEDSLYRVSLGEYVYTPKYDDRYQHWPALFRYCKEWVAAHRDGPYVEYKTEADCMSWGMQRLGALDKRAAPIPWTATIKRLRALQKAQTR